jgi:diguanylate cyclase (GGDEF)-like protein/PAS domain S-box-containing protein
MLPQGAFETVLENVHDGLYIVDRDRRITCWNRGAEAITGYRAEELFGSRCSDGILLHVDRNGNELCKGMCPLAAAMADGQTRETKVFLHHKAGHRVPVRVRVAPLRDDAGKIVGGVESFAEDSPREALLAQVEELRRLSLIDPLTELPNRRHFEAQMHASLARQERDGVPFGVLVADVDHFKDFNDRHGHEAGDRALKTVAATLALAVRPFDTVARWGGEEFAGIFPGSDREAIRVTGMRLCALVRQSPIVEAGQSLRVTISIGGACSRRGDTADGLFERADRTMYRSKSDGRDRVTVAAP